MIANYFHCTNKKEFIAATVNKQTNKQAKERKYTKEKHAIATRRNKKRNDGEKGRPNNGQSKTIVWFIPF